MITIFIILVIVYHIYLMTLYLSYEQHLINKPGCNNKINQKKLFFIFSSISLWYRSPNFPSLFTLVCSATSLSVMTTPYLFGKCNFFFCFVPVTYFDILMVLRSHLKKTIQFMLFGLKRIISFDLVNLVNHWAYTYNHEAQHLSSSLRSSRSNFCISLLSTSSLALSTITIRATRIRLQQ